MPNEDCVIGVCAPQRTQGLIAPAPNGDHLLVDLKGPGIFLGAEVTKQGGGTGITFVSLDIDGRNVTNISYAAAENSGLTQQNPYGLVLLQSAAAKESDDWIPDTVAFPEMAQIISDSQ